MKKLMLLSLLSIGLTALSGCTNSTDELNTYLNELTSANTRIGALDLFERNDVNRPIDMGIEMSLYEKCASFFDSNPDLANIKESLIYEEFLYLGMGTSDALLAPFLSFSESQDIQNLDRNAQNLILNSIEKKQVAEIIFNDFRNTPELREAKGFLQINKDFAKIKPFGICLAQELFVTLYGGETKSSDILRAVDERIDQETLALKKQSN